MNPLRETLEYGLVRTLIALLRPLPERCVLSAFRALGRLFFLLSARRRRITLQNLAIAFPDKSLRERRRIARAAFLNMAEFTGDSFLLLAGKLRPDDVLARVDDADLEKYRRLTAGNTQGVLHLTGHLGNWELLGNYGALRDFKSHVVARRGSNRLIDERIVVPLRTRYGNQVFYKEKAMTHTVRALKKNEAVAFLIDQKINAREGVPVRFFGREVLAVASCALLQIRMQPLVIPTFMIKTGPRQYRLKVGDPVPWEDDGAPREEQIQRLTQRHQTIIEEAVRAHPEQWFWMHDRFGLGRPRRRKKKNRRRAKRT